jgi:hypothetical protein
MPLLASVFFAAFPEHGHPAIGPTAKKIILAAVEDPLAVLAQRSPGRREKGLLHSTKPNPVPHQRVLSMVREHEPDPSFNAPAEPENPVFDEVPQAFGSVPGIIPGANPGNAVRPGDQGGTPPPSPQFFPITGPPQLWVFVGGGVPEPGSWVLLIAGFFAAGAALRRRERKQIGAQRENDRR